MNIKVKEYLKDKKEEVPTWLKNYKPGDKVDFNDVLYNHRVVYYPGCYIDGQPIRTFNKSHFAHTYLYVDYTPSKEETTKFLSEKEALKGYRLLDLREVSPNELGGTSFVQHFQPTKEQIEWVKSWAKHKPYCLMAIYERLPEYDESHGASRLALIYLYADGIATYDALFANHHKAPEVMIIQDHGFGGNYDSFGEGGALQKIAVSTNTLPHYIMFEHRRNWEQYNMVNGVDPEKGGMHGNLRFLYAERNLNEKGILKNNSAMLKIFSF